MHDFNDLVWEIAVSQVIKDKHHAPFRNLQKVEERSVQFLELPKTSDVKDGGLCSAHHARHGLLPRVL